MYDDQIQNIIWPQDPDADPGAIARLGRVLHWCIAAGGVWMMGGGIWDHFAHADANGGLGVAGGGVAVFLFGRAVRYVMSGE